MFATSPGREIWRKISCLRLYPMAQKGHQRLKYWRIYSWEKIHDLSPSREIWRKISCLRLFPGSDVWSQMSCLRFFPGREICSEYFSSKLGQVARASDVSPNVSIAQWTPPLRCIAMQLDVQPVPATIRNDNSITLFWYRSDHAAYWKNIHGKFWDRGKVADMKFYVKFRDRGKVADMKFDVKFREFGGKSWNFPWNLTSIFRSCVSLQGHHRAGIFIVIING